MAMSTTETQGPDHVKPGLLFAPSALLKDISPPVAANARHATCGDTETNLHDDMSSTQGRKPKAHPTKPTRSKISIMIMNLIALSMNNFASHQAKQKQKIAEDHSNIMYMKGINGLPAHPNPIQ